MPRTKHILIALLVYGLTAGVFWATSVKTLTIYPSMDSYGWESVPNANNGGSNNFEITSSIHNPKNMRGWIAFDVGQIPADAWLIAAKLRLRIWHKTTNEPSNGFGDSTGRIYGVYRVAQPWVEYNITWANQPNYTQEHHATAAVPLGQGGWDGPLLWMEWDVAAIVADWLSDEPNHGLVVRDLHENEPVLYSTQFFTHNKVPSEGYYPRLMVTYTTPQALAFLLGIFIAEGFFIIFITRMRGRIRGG